MGIFSSNSKQSKKKKGKTIHKNNLQHIRELNCFDIVSIVKYPEKTIARTHCESQLKENQNEKRTKTK